MKHLALSLPLVAGLAPLSLASSPTLSQSGFEAPAESVDLSEAIDAIRAEAQTPGLVAIAVQDGAIVAWGVSGVRAEGSEDPLQLGDPMHLGSCAKAMTATLIGRLVDEGVMSFDTTIGEALPELARRIDPGFHAVTVDQLIHHQGGIAERRRPEIQRLYEDLEDMEGSSREVRLELLALVMGPPPLMPEKGAFDYSNFGFMTAGAMAEAVTGETWEDLMAEKVFGPLQMSSAGTGSPAGQGVPVGHRPSDSGLQPLPPGPDGELHGCMGPAGLVHASLPDWARFASDHMRGERGEDGLLEGKTYKHLHADLFGSGYAAGWGVKKRSVSWSEPTASLTHNGSDGTWFSLIEIMPEWDLAVLAATNSGAPSAAGAPEKAVRAMLHELGFAD